MTVFTHSPATDKLSVSGCPLTFKQSICMDLIAKLDI